MHIYKFNYGSVALFVDGAEGEREELWTWMMVLRYKGGCSVDSSVGERHECGRGRNSPAKCVLCGDQK